MPAKSSKQRKAAGAELNRRREGKQPMNRWSREQLSHARDVIMCPYIWIGPMIVVFGTFLIFGGPDAILYILQHPFGW